LAFEFLTLVFEFKTLVFEFLTPVFKSKTQALQSGNSDFEVRELQIGVFFDNNGIKMAHHGSGCLPLLSL
jgi:hypothetical protein